MKRSWAAGLAAVLAFVGAGVVLREHHPPRAAGRSACSGAAAQIVAAPVHRPIAVGWSRRWASSASPIVERRGATWEPDPLIARGMQCYLLPIPIAGTWTVVFGVTPSHARLALTATGTAGVVRQDADTSNMRHVAMTVPAAAGRLRVNLEATGGPTVITSVTLTLVRRATSPLRIAFADDFHGRRLDRAKWKTETGGHGWGNRELQSYTSNPANVRVTAGRLAITARRAPFTSARLDSRFAATYGHLEARIKTPGGAGLLPAFWMLGADADHVPWPACGEIDIMESLGQREPFTVHASIHGSDHRDNPWQRTTPMAASQPLSAGFHTYALDWWPNSVQLSFDGRAYASYTPDDLAANQRWPFDKPYYLLLNLAVGGDWPGTPSPALPFPQTMQVDDVRWWR